MKHYETRPAPYGKTVLEFDDSGENLIAIRGQLPDDIDLAYGWGPLIKGLSLGIGANTLKGSLDDICITESVKNLSSTQKLLLSTFWYHLIKMELHDSTGKVVLQDEQQIKKRTTEFIRRNHGIHEGSRSSEPGDAQSFGDYQLNLWYSDLAPGKYTLVVKRRSTGDVFDLLSNTLSLEIVAKRQE